jgi:hypothetical protein
MKGAEVDVACANTRTKTCLILVLKRKELEMLGRAGPREEGNTVEPGYKDIGVCATSTKSIRYSVVPIISSLLTVTSSSLFRTSLVYNDKIFSPFQNAVTACDHIENESERKRMGVVEWIQLTQDRNQWQACINTSFQ